MALSAEDGEISYGTVALATGGAVHVLEHFLRPIVIGANVFDANLVWEAMYRGTLNHGRKGLVLAAISAVDIALRDLKGRVLGQPVYNLLGGRMSETIPSYASRLYATLLAGLVREVPGIRYLKIEALPSAPKIAALARLLSGDPEGAPALIGGAGGPHLVDKLRRGARATMPGCFYADIFVHICATWQVGDRAGAQRALHRALPLLLHAGQSFSAFVGTQKGWLRRAGLLDSARLRARRGALGRDLWNLWRVRRAAGKRAMSGWRRMRALRPARPARHTPRPGKGK